ncbi:hypothetical protein Zmor_014527 [Zophobas morio]|uniref:Sodium channel protein Nach n=1 Tax=Zophobas morio TaxID=2755281 RepID=A0AA38IF98_9CUCU|nr:hypothetical protein Zmor_014527 [Zophobas morio]
MFIFEGNVYKIEGLWPEILLFWTTILLMSVTGCVYMISEILTKYEKNPVVVSFATKDTPNYEIPFPSVTICPESKFQGSKFNYTDMFYKRILRKKPLSSEDVKHFGYMTVLCNNDSPMVTLHASDTVEEDFFSVIEDLKPDDEIFCSFMDSDSACVNYVTHIITDQGICYSFNILDRNHIYRENISHYKDYHTIANTSVDYDGDLGYKKTAGVNTYPVRALASGADNSLTLIFVHRSLNNDYICNQFLNGFRISLHSPRDVPRLSQSYFRVPLNKAVTAAVKPELTLISPAVKSLRPETRNCYLQNERPLQYFKLYTQSNCLLECLTNYTLKKCGCVQYFMPRVNDTKICGAGKIPCVKKAQIQLKIEELENKITEKMRPEETFCDCKPSCTSLRYDVEISLTDNSWKEFAMASQEYNEFSNINTTDSDISMVSIYFKDEQFIPIARNEIYGARRGPSLNPSDRRERGFNGTEQWRLVVIFDGWAKHYR